MSPAARIVTAPNWELASWSRQAFAAAVQWRGSLVARLRPAAAWLRPAVERVRQLAPYAAIELLLPGGTLFAIGLWLYRRHRAARQARVAAKPIWPNGCKWSYQ